MAMIKLDLREIKDNLITSTKTLRNMIAEYVSKEIALLSTRIIKSLKSAFDEICVRIESVEKLIEAEKWIEQFFGEELLNLETSYQETINWLERMMVHLEFNVDVFKQVLETKQCLSDYTEKILKEKERVYQERESFERRLTSKRGVVNQKGIDMALKVENIQKEGRLFWMDRIMSDINEAIQIIEDTLLEIQLINHEEVLLGH